jgi:hypothetical protein
MKKLTQAGYLAGGVKSAPARCIHWGWTRGDLANPPVAASPSRGTDITFFDGAGRGLDGPPPGHVSYSCTHSAVTLLPDGPERSVCPLRS